jgi:cell wall-associated NlpC family hydrolase
MYMPWLDDVATGVDCSGLVNLVFRAHGTDVPRDAHEQWMRAAPVSGESLRPGDLVFVPLSSGIVNHVMIFAGKEDMIEAPDMGGTVRIITFREKFGKELAEINESTGMSESRKVLFGRMAPFP